MRRNRAISRRAFWRRAGAAPLVASGAFAAGPARAAGSGIVMDYGGPAPRVDEAVLFPFDDHAVPLRYRLRVGLVSADNPYKPHPRVLEKGGPGSPDSLNLSFYGSVVRVGDELRMWYLGSPARGVHHACYAVSKDGRHWEKPALGLVEHEGNRRNNLVDFARKDLGALIVIHDPEDPDPARRFKLIYEVHPFYIGAAFSPDGLRWRDSPANPILKHNAIEPSGLTRFGGAYILNGQGGNVGTKRALVSFLSYDFDRWSDAVAVGLRRDVPPHRQEPGPHAGEQVHLGAALWNRGNVLVGVYGQWHGRSNDRRFVEIDLGLVVTNDALHFREPIPDFRLVSAAEIVMAQGPEAMIPAPALEQGQAFDNVGDETLFWYSPWYGGSICAASWGRDRLGYFEVVEPPKPSVRATEDTHALAWREYLDIVPEMAAPHFVTCPLRAGGSETRVFVNAGGLSDDAQLVVELLDERLVPLPRYSGADCVPVARAGLREPVAWRSGQTADTGGRPFRIKVGWRGKRPAEAYVYAVYVV
jgi:hypothetical protein